MSSKEEPKKPRPTGVTTDATAEQTLMNVAVALPKNTSLFAMTASSVRQPLPRIALLRLL